MESLENSTFSPSLNSLTSPYYVCSTPSSTYSPLLSPSSKLNNNDEIDENIYYQIYLKDLHIPLDYYNKFFRLFSNNVTSSTSSSFSSALSPTSTKSPSINNQLPLYDSFRIVIKITSKLLSTSPHFKPLILTSSLLSIKSCDEYSMSGSYLVIPISQRLFFSLPLTFIEIYEKIIEEEEEEIITEKNKFKSKKIKKYCEKNYKNLKNYIIEKKNLRKINEKKFDMFINKENDEETKDNEEINKQYEELNNNISNNSNNEIIENEDEDKNDENYNFSSNEDDIDEDEDDLYCYFYLSPSDSTTLIPLSEPLTLSQFSIDNFYKKINKNEDDFASTLTSNTLISISTQNSSAASPIISSIASSTQKQISLSSSIRLINLYKNKKKKKNFHHINSTNMIIKNFNNFYLSIELKIFNDYSLILYENKLEVKDSNNNEEITNENFKNLLKLNNIKNFFNFSYLTESSSLFYLDFLKILKNYTENSSLISSSTSSSSSSSSTSTSIPLSSTSNSNPTQDNEEKSLINELKNSILDKDDEICDEDIKNNTPEANINFDENNDGEIKDFIDMEKELNKFFNILNSEEDLDQNDSITIQSPSYTSSSPNNHFHNISKKEFLIRNYLLKLYKKINFLQHHLSVINSINEKNDRFISKKLHQKEKNIEKLLEEYEKLSNILHSFKEEYNSLYKFCLRLSNEKKDSDEIQLRSAKNYEKIDEENEKIIQELIEIKVI